MRREGTRSTRTDYPLMLVVVLLVVLGLMMIYSATFILRSDPAYFLKRQVLWAVLGLILLVLLARVDYRELAHLALPIMGLSFLSLVVVLFMGGNGAFRIWFLGTSVQPSEFAKLAFIIYIAAWLASKGDKIRDVTYGLIPFAVLLGIVAGLILLEPDIGTAILIMATAVAMFFISGAEISQLFVGLMAGAPALYLMIVNSGVAMERLTSFFNLGKDTAGMDYHVVSLLSALRAGGLTGRGLGAGQQKLFPPYVYHTDTILSVIGEELGLIGCLAVVGLFLFIAYRGLAISFRAPDTFGSLLAFGITCWIAFQAMIHVGGNTATIPFTGLTLPFVSYGGSSLTMCLAGVGVLVSISRLGRERTLRTSATLAFGGRNRRPRLSGSRRRRGTSKRGRR
ncbi:MAG: cell division protein FtsW [Anaerolineales bacterium]|nr:MAG: cell division protein FtsW [Anaerolineales bacterium]